jgi:hypothetical protein
MIWRPVSGRMARIRPIKFVVIDRQADVRGWVEDDLDGAAASLVSWNHGSGHGRAA